MRLYRILEFSVEGAPTSNHSVIGHCKVKCSLCSMQQARWSIHWAGQVMRGGCGFATSWSFSVEDTLLGNHSAQSPASVYISSPGCAMVHCKVECCPCSLQQVRWSLNRVLRQCWAGGLWGLRFYRFLEVSSIGGLAQQPQCTELCQCVCGQPWACHWALQGQMQLPKVCSR